MIHKALLHNCYNTVCAIRLSSFSNFVNIDFISSLFSYPSRLASHKYKDIFFYRFFSFSGEKYSINCKY